MINHLKQKSTYFIEDLFINYIQFDKKHESSAKSKK